MEIGDVVIDNKVYITMSKKPNVVDLELINPLGGSICGTATISAMSGEILFDGNPDHQTAILQALFMNNFRVLDFSVPKADLLEDLYLKYMNEEELTEIFNRSSPHEKEAIKV